MGAATGHLCGSGHPCGLAPEEVSAGLDARSPEKGEGSTAASDDRPTPGGGSAASSDAADPPQAGSACGEASVTEVECDALRRAAELMQQQEYDVLEAEAVLAEALKRLEDNQEACDRIRQSPVFVGVSDRVAQHDAIADMLTNDKFASLWEDEDGKFEINQTEGSWFDYKMTLNIDAPLSACLSTGQELELVPQAQPLMSGVPDKLGPCGKFVLVTLMRLSVLIFNIELLFEIVRFRHKRFGFITESIRSSFPANGLRIPAKGWRAVRPWVCTANVWMPRGDGEQGTVLVQVTRVDCGFNVPQLVLNFVFRNLASTFMSDLRKSAAKAAEESSPWADAIRKDATGLYADVRELEEAASGRRLVTAKTFPGREVFDRPWRLWPVPVDTRPPSSR